MSAGDSQDALRAVWMEGYAKGRTEAGLLAKLVRQAWERDDALAMRLFGNNMALMIAGDVERATTFYVGETLR